MSTLWRKYCSFAAVITVVFGCVAGFAIPVKAADGLTLSPPLRDITLGPGLLEATTDISLTNNTPQQVRAQLKLVDLKALGEFGGNSLGQAGLPDSYGLANWMVLPGGDTVLIASGQTVKIAVNIINREDLSPGGHYGAIIVTADSNDKAKGNVNISQQLVSLVFAKKLGGEKYGLDLKDFSYTESSSRIPEEVKLNFSNTGNVHVVPRGYVEITDPKGKLISKTIINPDSSLVLPGASRQLLSLMQPVASSSEKGEYKVTAYYRYDEQSQFTSKTITFTNSSKIIKSLFIGTVIAGLSIIIVFVLWRRFRSRTIQPKA